MKPRLFFVLLLGGLCAAPPRAASQNVALSPSVVPAIFRYNEPITVTYNATGTPLASLMNAWIWVWIPDKNINARYNIAPATAAAARAKFTRSVVGNAVSFSITFRPSDFFSEDISAETRLGMLLKSRDWGGGQTADFIAGLSDGSFQVKLTSPASQPLFVHARDHINITAETTAPSDFNLYVNDVLTDTKTNITSYSYVRHVTETSGSAAVNITAVKGSERASAGFRYIISAASPLARRPSGTKAGINYAADPSQVTLCLQAPNKSSVYLQGDFSHWEVLPANLMKRDGEYFWITLTGLTPAAEYAYRFLVEERIFVADPFADKILTPDDVHIPEATYPGLKPFPPAAMCPEWYFNRVSVFQTGQQPYVWKNAFKPPPASSLVIYELLIRDFFEPGKRNFQSLIDTLSYLKRTGVNAIELMPVGQFNGNEGWGYNPAFQLAPHKYYGTKNKLKEFIDACHGKGIAVILDLVMNHQDLPCPMAMLDFDFAAMKPTPANKWFNADATHPYSVFFDFNHESPYTQKYLDTINRYWITEYKIDGYRYDLSKGFTQRNSGSDVGAWSAYDASRIALLNRMKDEIRKYSPASYLILEHFGDDREEKDLATSGFMLWGNLNDSFSKNAEGREASLSRLSYKERGFSKPGVVGYMDSHDEERVMVNALRHGREQGGYSAKDLNTALTRMKAAYTILLTVPGPKMIWQFGELGYDYSINTCDDGTLRDNCRLSNKPVVWHYAQLPPRKALLNHIGKLNALRANPVFQTPDFTFADDGLTKTVILKNTPYNDSPVKAENMNVAAVANFDLQSRTVSVAFPHAGVWHEYFSGTAYTVSDVPKDIRLDAGASLVFIDVAPAPKKVTGVEEGIADEWTAFPVPADRVLRLSKPVQEEELEMIDLEGRRYPPVLLSPHELSTKNLAEGIYFLRIKQGGTYMVKFMVKRGL